ncbi:hypothetical protein C3920_15790 [Novacetimonas pomaceti]|uniref:Uncharacterized protein n=1 Tax=Novacetimonas pomaceti TaxID=2021998 RepID=A0ABX5NY38_9PROT|nr:hypothetical protein C3920_15790 [Novacetimonas pomaceti]
MRPYARRITSLREPHIGRVTRLHIYIGLRKCCQALRKLNMLGMTQKHLSYLNQRHAELAAAHRMIPSFPVLRYAIHTNIEPSNIFEVIDGCFHI